MQNINSSIMRITPEISEKLLNNNPINRSISNTAVRTLAAQMKHGLWRMNGEAIIISDKGELLDGQHRLYACIEADTSFETIVVINVASSAFDTIDTGKPRSAADILTIRGVDKRTAIACAGGARLAILLERYGSITCGGDRGSAITPSLVAAYVGQHPRLLELTKKIVPLGGRTKIIPAAMCSFLWYEMEKKEPSRILDTEDFFTGTLTAIGLSKYDPRLYLVKKFYAEKTSARKLKNTQRIGCVIRAWDWYMRGVISKHPQNMFRELTDATKLLIC